MKTFNFSTKLIVFLVLISCFIEGQSQSKVTIKNYVDPSKSGVESIIFEYEERAPGQNGGQSQQVKKVFDVNENNPFNQLSQKTISEGLNGSLVKEFPVEGRKEVFENLGLKYDPNRASSKVPLSGHSFLTTNSMTDKYIVLAYRYSLFGPGGDLSANGRLSSITILDQKGNVYKKVENIPSDVYSQQVSDNGHYLLYAYGGFVEHAESHSQKSGFKIIDLRNMETIYDQDAFMNRGIFINGNEINIRSDEADGEFFYSFDQNTALLYRVESNRLGPHIGFQQFRGPWGPNGVTDTLYVLKDFQLVK